MVCRSDVVIAVHKHVYTQSLIENKIPSMLNQDDCVSITEDALYWHFVSIQWYDTFPVVKAVADYLDLLLEVPRPPLPGETYDEASFGLYRIGEELDDNDSMGDPCLYGMELRRQITWPAPENQEVQ
jgi:hypothetical protein